MELAQGEACLGVHQVDEGADAEIAFQFGLFRAGQGVVLIFDGELMHPVEVGLVEEKRLRTA